MFHFGHHLNKKCRCISVDTFFAKRKFYILVTLTRFSLRSILVRSTRNQFALLKGKRRYFESCFNELQSKQQLRCLMIIKAVHVVGNYIHFHAAFSLLCLLPTKEIISGGVAAVAEGKKLGAKPDTLRCMKAANATCK